MKALYRNNTTLGPGNGFIEIDDLSPLPELDGLRFTLKRGSDHNNLGPGGWQGAESVLQPESLTLTDTGIALVVNKAVVDHLDPRESYRITLITADGMHPVGRLEVPEVAYSLQGAEHGSLAGPHKEIPAPQPAPEPEPEPEPAPPLESEPEPEPALSIPDTPPAKKGMRHLLVGVLLLVLLGIAAAIGWKLYSDTPETEPQTATQEEQQGEPKPQVKPALTQAREHLAGAADPEQSLALGKELLGEPDGSDAAFLLVEDAAEKGNSEAMLLTGGFYDPADESPSGSIITDPAQALAWYKKAKDAGNAGAEARIAALRQWAEAEAAKGNADAKALLGSMQ